LPLAKVETKSTNAMKKWHVYLVKEVVGQVWVEGEDEEQAQRVALASEEILWGVPRPETRVILFDQVSDEEYRRNE
jgi:hypothetical protein